MRARAREDEERFTNEIAHLETALRHTRGEAREQADRLEIARADNSMLQGAVEALRKDHARLRDAAAHGVAEATPLDARDLAALRREIADLAARLIETPDIPPRERDAAGAKRAL